MRLFKLAVFFLSVNYSTMLCGSEVEELAIQIETFQGKEVIPHLKQLAMLRLAFYREYPYLYEGDLCEEEKYLQLYSQSEQSVLTLAKSGDNIIGVLTGVPLEESSEAICALFSDNGVSPKSVFYLGEIVTAPEYQESDVQQMLYERFEEVVIGLKHFDTIAVCEVERDDLAVPRSGFSAEVDWDNRGFLRHPELATFYTWRDIGQSELSDHRMVFWNKCL